jgi:hypothetical protein
LKHEKARASRGLFFARLNAMSKAIKRCKWAEGVSLDYIRYHDEEWGVPVHDDRTQFEFLILEGAQAGLSWSTILNKREGYRKLFADFDPEKVARFTKKRTVHKKTRRENVARPVDCPKPSESRVRGDQCESISRNTD